MKLCQKTMLGVSLLIMCIFAANHTVNQRSYYAVTDGIFRIQEGIAERIRLRWETDVMADVIGKMYYVDGAETADPDELDPSRDLRRVYVSREKKQLIDETNDYSVLLPRDTRLTFLADGVKAEHDDFALRITRLTCTPETLAQELDSTWRSEEYAFSENLYIRETKTENYHGVSAEVFIGAHLDDPDNGFVVICMAGGEKAYELKFYGNIYEGSFQELCRETAEQFQWR